MEHFICIQCGTQFDEAAQPPSSCPICEDERQFVRHAGQGWTTLERLAANHHNRFDNEAPQLVGIGTEPDFAIGQRALVLQSPGGNLLWDCITLLDDKTVAEVNASGGIRAVAISHPHYYSAMIEWSERFDAQIFLHAADREWVMRKSSRIRFWEGTTLSLWHGLTLINCGGHFDGSTVLHWPDGSYPNLIPLGPAAVHRILETIEPFAFDQIYGAWWKANVLSDAKGAVARSAQRYLRAIGTM